MSQKVIAVYFSDPEPMGYPFHKEYYVEAYTWLSDELARRGYAMRIVRNDSYQGDGVFSRSWKFVDGVVVEAESPLNVDLIFNRDDANTIPHITDCPIINHPDFDQLCLDKYETAQTFPAISPKTVLVHTYQEYLDAVSEWPDGEDDLIVLKKNFETEGRSIYIGARRGVTQEKFETWENVLVQQFLDGSGGIPGITDGLHDLRVTTVNGAPTNCFIRVPKEGSYLANVAAGATGFSIELDQVPEEVMQEVRVIIDRVAHYAPTIFSADFLLSDHGWKLVELNSRPALQHRDWSADYMTFNMAVADMLDAAVRAQ